jgi:hypothetical protein
VDLDFFNYCEIFIAAACCFFVDAVLLFNDPLGGCLEKAGNCVSSA